ncbi:glycosyltransferase [Clostridium baratii]
MSSISISSGVASVIMNYYRNIDRNKVQFDFLYFNDDKITYEKEINKLGGKIYKIERPKISKKSVLEIKNFFYAVRGKYSILHNHEVYLNFILSPLAKKNGFKAVITHSHTTSYSDKFISLIRNRFLCIPLKKQADYFMACSKAAGSALYGVKYIKNNKVFILNNAIDCEKFKYNEEKRGSIRKQLGIESKFVLGHVGRFNSQKNHKFLLKIFSEVLKRDKSSILLLVGDGPLFNEVKKLSQEMNLYNNIIFLGRKENINEILQGIDVFVLPSLYEGLPVIGVEAQCSGVNCIMSTNITDEVNICNSEFMDLNKSEKAWAEHIIALKGKKRDIDAWTKLYDARFEIRSEAENLKNFYIKIVN